MRITEIEIDYGNEEYLTRHGVSLTEVQQVLANNPDIRRNRKDRAGTHLARAEPAAAGASSSRSLIKATDGFDPSPRGR